jgi:trimeric autotransporter adhesin
MAAQTGQLGLVTPTQGTLSGTWGDTVNNGITEYVNIAIAGTLSFSGDGAVTLANTLGDASASNIGTTTAQYACIRVTGTSTTKVITGPSYSKTYLVDNASSYAITFKASGETGVSIAAGEKAIVFFNSAAANADYVKVASTVPISTVPISSGGTGQTTATAAFDALAPTTTQGDTIYFNGTDNVRLAKGTAGQALVMNSGATAPEWGTAGISTGKSIAMAMIFGF